MSRLCRQLGTKLGLAIALEQLKLSNCPPVRIPGALRFVASSKTMSALVIRIGGGVPENRSSPPPNATEFSLEAGTTESATTLRVRVRVLKSDWIA
jgi:hypothetical protein